MTRKKREIKSSHVPPKFCPATERRVINWLICGGDWKDIEIQKVMLRINDECFYGFEAKELFRLVKSRFEQKHHFDIIAVNDALATYSDEVFHYFQNHIVAMDYRETLDDTVVDELIQYSVIRKQSKIILDMLNGIHNEPNIIDCVKTVSDGITKIGLTKLNKLHDGIGLKQIAKDYLAGNYKESEKISTGIRSLDEKLKGGIDNKILFTIAGDSGVGKTFFSLYMMRKISEGQPQKQSLFFTLEMTHKKMWDRLIGILSHKTFARLHTHEIEEAIDKSFLTPTFFYEEQFKNINEIETICRIKAIEQPLSVVVVDYLTLVENNGAFERNDLRQADITKRLASLAMELDCIVISTSQVNRNLSGRPKDDRCPYPADVADSTGSVRSSSIWFGIDRPELYSDDPCYKNKFIVKCRKDRNGGPFDYVFNFNEGTFEEIDQIIF